ncbi:META domain-containing protein [Nakamurella sp. YIM 132087]|uniref:META domain-containing protein n=1 Tax=Nakamurella alba TaxID=2665158 RepID=A0A7K1FLN1_9ACTN|nr:META domain-containing protein [Nakamurella alba]MTD14970.1 META domain-containing protein [Nakamurella alba]
MNETELRTLLRDRERFRPDLEAVRAAVESTATDRPRPSRLPRVVLSAAVVVLIAITGLLIRTDAAPPPTSDISGTTTASTTPEVTSTIPAGLTDVRWVLTSVIIEGTRSDPTETWSMVLRSGGRADIFLPCASGSGSWSAAGSGLTLRWNPTTDNACFMDPAAWKALEELTDGTPGQQRPVGIEVVGSALRIEIAGTIMIFRHPTWLGRHWHIGGSGAGPDITFADDGTLRVVDDCGSYDTTWTSTGDQLVIRDAAALPAGCNGPEWSAIDDWAGRTFSFRADRATLTLTDNRSGLVTELLAVRSSPEQPMALPAGTYSRYCGSTVADSDDVATSTAVQQLGTSGQVTVLNLGGETRSYGRALLVLVDDRDRIISLSVEPAASVAEVDVAPGASSSIGVGGWPRGLCDGTELQPGRSYLAAPLLMMPDGGEFLGDRFRYIAPEPTTYGGPAPTDPGACSTAYQGLEAVGMSVTVQQSTSGTSVELRNGSDSDQTVVSVGIALFGNSGGDGRGGFGPPLMSVQRVVGLGSAVALPAGGDLVRAVDHLPTSLCYADEDRLTAGCRYRAAVTVTLARADGSTNTFVGRPFLWTSP